MKPRFLLILLLSALSVSLAACDLLTGAPPTYIKTAVMARDAQGANLDPVGVSNTFAPDAEAFHVVVTLVNAPKDTILKAIWTVVDVGTAAPANTKVEESEVRVEGSRNVDFKTKRIAQKWNAAG